MMIRMFRSFHFYPADALGSFFVSLTRAWQLKLLSTLVCCFDHFCFEKELETRPRRHVFGYFGSLVAKEKRNRMRENDE